MVTIVFEAHSTTVDNENHVSSGHFDVELSELGRKQSKELGDRYADDNFDAIFCSDLQRSYKTTELAFGDRFPIIKDSRLRECDYGDLRRHASSEVDPQKANRITEPFPNGESYEQTAQRMGNFLTDWIVGKTVTEAVTAPWKWQPGWTYQLKEVQS